jgi:hypothetical protein
VNALPDMLQASMLRREPLCAVVPTTHPLAARKLHLRAEAIEAAESHTGTIETAESHT